MNRCGDRCKSSCVYNLHLCIGFSLVSNNYNSRSFLRATVDGSSLSDLRDSLLTNLRHLLLLRTPGLRRDSSRRRAISILIHSKPTQATTSTPWEITKM